jgi:hypothetical protein
MKTIEQIWRIKTDIVARLETMTARDASDYCIRLAALLMALSEQSVKAERERALLWVSERKKAATTRDADMAVKASDISVKCAKISAVLQTGQELLNALKKRQTI